MQQTRSAGMNRATPYLYVIPCILLLGIFVYIPLVVNFFYSTQTFSAFSRCTELNFDLIYITLWTNKTICIN